MASFTFNGIDMSAYGLTIRRRRHPFIQRNESIQLLNRAYGLASLRPAGQINLDIVIEAANHDALKIALDDIKGALNRRGNVSLEVEYYNDRYWMARFNSIDVYPITPEKMEGMIIFDVFDPAAYSTTEEDNDHTIILDPELFTETAGGTEQVRPVITLTCDDTLPSTTVEIENQATGGVIEWTGDLVPTDILEFDCEAMMVKLNGVMSMLTVEGQFPKLLVGDNAFIVRGFSGNCNFTYRVRYV